MDSTTKPSWLRRHWIILAASAVAIPFIIALAVVWATSSKDVFHGRIDTARAFDGDTFRLIGHKEKFRLWGIDALESKQDCGEVKGVLWRCGVAATRALAELVGSDTITCIRHSKDLYGRIVVVCSVRRIEINQWMVRQGWARAYTSYSKKYVPDETLAREEKLGLWKGTSVPPWDWRKHPK